MLRQHEIAMLLFAQLVQDGADEPPGVLRVGLHVPHHHLHVDILGRVPAVVVGRHTDHLVSDLRLACELGLGKDGHVDDGAAPGAVEV